MEPASTIIKLLGGDTAVADALGIHRTRVSNWKRPKAGGGTDGRVPQWHIQKMIEMARERGHELTFNDFAWPPSRARDADEGAPARARAS